MKQLFFLTLCWLGLVFCSRAEIRSYSRVSGGVRFQLDHGLMQIDILAGDVVRVRYTGMDSLPVRHSLVVASSLPAGTAFTVVEKDGHILITTDRLVIVVDRATNAITYSDLSGGEILAEDGVDGKTMSPAEVVGVSTYTCRTAFRSPGGEGLFGLGCHPLDSGSIDYKGRKQEMAIKYLTGAIPVLLSSRGYGLMWDNYSQSAFDGTEGGDTKFSYSSESGQQVDYYFF